MTKQRAQDILNRASAASANVYAANNDAALEDFIDSTDISNNEKDEALKRSTPFFPGIVGGLRQIANN